MERDRSLELKVGAFVLATLAGFVAMIIVLARKNESAMGPRPLANMWWLHTPQPMNPISTPAYTTTG